MSVRIEKYDSRFRLRTLFVVMATCAAAFAVMVRWPNSHACLIAACVPATWLVQGLVMALHSMDYLHGWPMEPLRATCVAAATSVIVAEWIMLTVVVGAALQWAFG